jgi:hypothetical protein
MAYIGCGTIENLVQMRRSAGCAISRIVCVNAIEALFELARKAPALMRQFQQMEEENTPSIKARIKKIRKEVFNS